MRVPDPFAPLAKSAGFDFSSTLFLPLRPPSPFHGFTQELVDPGLVSASLALQPGQHIGIPANRHRLSDEAVKLPHYRPSPVPHFRRIRQIDLVVRHPRQRGKLLRHFPRDLPHKSSFPAASPFAPRCSVCIPLRPLHGGYVPPVSILLRRAFPPSSSAPPPPPRRGPALRWHGDPQIPASPLRSSRRALLDSCDSSSRPIRRPSPYLSSCTYYIIRTNQCDTPRRVAAPRTAIL